MARTTAATTAGIRRRRLNSIERKPAILIDGNIQRGAVDLGTRSPYGPFLRSFRSFGARLFVAPSKSRWSANGH